MKGSTLMVAILLPLAFVGPANARAQARRLKKADLPLAVQRTVDEHSKGATMLRYSSELQGGQLEYEVEMTVSGHSRDVSIAPDGSILKIEEQVTLDALPAAVREGLQRAAGAGRITRVESLTKRGTLVAYEAQVRTGNARSEIQVGPDGKPLAHEE